VDCVVLLQMKRVTAEFATLGLGLAGLSASRRRKQ
jgi:hypothetical protein